MKNRKKLVNIFEKTYKSNDLLNELKNKIKKCIQFELMFVIAICFLISFLFYNFTNNLLKKEITESQITYDYDSIEHQANDLLKNIENKENLTLSDTTFIESELNKYSNDAKCYITDLDGKILFKTSNVAEDSIDIYTALKNAMTNINYKNTNMVKEKNYIMPLKVNNERVYLIYSKIPEATITYDVIRVSNSHLALVLTFLVFIISFVIITNDKMKYLDEIASGLKIIASGNLNYRIKEKGDDEIRNIAYNINNMAKEIDKKIQAERLAEKAKTDLIANVSHDLRTPLTSVMGYLGLVIDNRYKNEEEMYEYLNIAFSKAERLKLLIEDLFEYTKLNNGGIVLSKSNVNISEFLSQLLEEFFPILNENNLTVYKKFENEKLIVSIDTLKMLRVFENILTNAIKYSYKPGEIIIALYEDNGYAMIVFRNKGDNIPKEKADKLFDRFYRTDESRNSNTGGSGLGLAISKNIVELHKGNMWVQSIGNNINFYIKLKL